MTRHGFSALLLAFALVVADALADGLAKQFPEKF